ncbi:MAG: low molecular weight phosphotyrosine protein phosphatase [Spirochaetales bacterium]|nr:low molecular weight phosphotyrosine protein phosphatase [Spirochaetales bacterium]
MGNICRSPLAHGVFQHMVNQKGLENRIVVDSCGTISYHAGELPDQRMRAQAAQHGITLDHRARQIEAADLHDFDLILAMDKSNLFHIKELAKGKGQYKAKIKLFREYDTAKTGKEVPDPYYGGPDGFTRVYEIVDRTCRNLLTNITGTRT